MNPWVMFLPVITRDTGYRFNLNRKWQDSSGQRHHRQPDAGTGAQAPAAQSEPYDHLGSGQTVTIMVIGKADPSRSGPAISFKAPPRSEPEETESSIETDEPPADEPDPADAAAADEEDREPADSAEELSGEPAEPDPSEADTPPEGLEADD
jgi:hypothetical protein